MIRLGAPVLDITFGADPAAGMAEDMGDGAALGSFIVLDELNACRLPVDPCADELRGAVDHREQIGLAALIA